MKVRIEIDCDNVSFRGRELYPETMYVIDQAKRQLEKVFRDVSPAYNREGAPRSVDLWDSEGNTVGTVEIL